MAYRTCDDCTWNDGTCVLGHDDIYLNQYDENQCDDGNGAIYLDDDECEDEDADDDE